MKFCDTCDNMYYLTIDENNSNKLMYYCRNCGVNQDNLNTIETSIVSSVQLINNETTMSHIINKYTKLDPTLPRINRIPCPNPECDTNDKNKNTEREIIYIRYDETNIKYLYLCSTCDYAWKTNEA
jgi:DNA-directed RNA polymerase subunit M/transcription elongation factor TFIIS